MNTAGFHDGTREDLSAGAAVLAVLALSAAGIGTCINNERNNSKAVATQITHKIPSRVEFLNSEADKLADLGSLPSEWHVKARDEAMQPTLDALVRAKNALSLVRDMLSFHLDYGMKEDFALRQFHVRSEFWPVEVADGPHYIEAVTRAKESALEALNYSLNTLSNRTNLEGCDADSIAIGKASTDLHVLIEHAKSGSLSLDEQYITVNKFGDKRVLGVSQPLFEAEGSVAAAITQLK